MRRVLLVASLVALASSSCFCLPPRPPPPGLQGQIAGKILVSSASGQSVKPALDILGPVAKPVSEVAPAKSKLPSDWKAGDVLIAFEHRAYTNETLPIVDMLKQAKLDVDARVVRCTARLYCLVELTRNGAVLDKEETRAAVEVLQKNRIGAVKNVSCNMKKYGFRVPNDPLFSFQWHYEAIGMTAAWDIQIGDPDVVVAVVDSGIVKAHPDINDRLARDPLDNGVVGVDLVDAQVDLDEFPGRDTDPEDPGDNLFADQGGGSSFHGSHIAGVIGAESDNGQGITGITWATQIVPVRVLGEQLNGFDSDIVDGLFWAVGDTEVQDVPDNVKPAKIVNLSLGGPGDNGSQEFWALNVDFIFNDPEAATLYPQGPLMIAAAGNSDEDASIIVPANLPGMIAVGASNITGVRASYSNFGGVIDVMAPGGQSGGDINSDGQPDTILSLVGTNFDYREGTSMAAPHVTGIVALLVAANPTLTQAEAEGIIRNSADPAGRCSEGCGAGSLDAVKALLLGGGEIQPEPFLATNVSQVTFPLGFASAQLQVLNLGNAPFSFDAVVEGAQAQLFTVSPASGTVSAATSPDGGVTTLQVSLARSGFEAGAANVKITTTDVDPPQEVFVSLAFNDDPTRTPRQIGSIEVAAFAKNEDGTRGDRVATTFAVRETNFEYEITGLRAGEYFISALADDDNDGQYETGESFGAYPTKDEPQVVLVPEDGRTEGIDFGIDSPFITDIVGGVGQSCTGDTQCTFADDAECVLSFEGGYCSRLCDSDGFCGQNGRCEVVECDFGNGPEPCGVCLVRCASDAQCRFDEGYVCDDGECVPDFFVNP